MRYQLSREADADVDALLEWGAKTFGVSVAENYARGLHQILNLLADHPQIAALRPSFSPPVRVHPYESHMIFYRESADGIVVSRILHGSADWRRHMGEG